MTIIDVHVHLAPMTAFQRAVQDYFRSNNPAFARDFASTADSEAFLAVLDAARVDRAVILAEYAPAVTGRVSNEAVCRLASSSPRIIPFGGLDLDDDTPPEEQARSAVETLGVRGFKLLPSYARHDPADPRLEGFYGYCSDKGLPVTFHTGTSIFPGSRIRFADPLLVDDVADAFPDLPVILAHGGRPFWYDRARWMLARHPNVHIDISGMPVPRLAELFPSLERRSDRFLFGSDWPGTGPIERWIDAVKGLPLSEEARERILGGNAARLLGV